MIKIKYTVATAIGAILMTGCLHTEEPLDEVKAVLDAPSAAVVAQVKSVVAQLVERPEITLSKSAFIKESWINIERAHKLSSDPSMEKAIKLQLVKRGEQCLIRHEASGQSLPLPGVSCVPEKS